MTEIICAVGPHHFCNVRLYTKGIEHDQFSNTFLYFVYTVLYYILLFLLHDMD